MDVNGLRFWSLSRHIDWFGAAQSAQDLQWCEQHQTLRLAAQSRTPQVTESATVSASLLKAPAPVADRQGNLFAWNSTQNAILPFGSANLQDAFASGGATPTDLAFGDDDILYVARQGHIELHDTRRRFAPTFVSSAGFAAHKLATIAGGGVYALDTTQGQIAKLSGQPLQQGLYPPQPLGQFAPAIENPSPPVLVILQSITITDTKLIAVSSQGRIAILASNGTDNATIHVLDEEMQTLSLTLASLKHPASLAWIGEHSIAVITTQDNAVADEAFVYDVQQNSNALPNGKTYPLVNASPSPFLNIGNELPHYAGEDGVARALTPVSGLTFARDGTVQLTIDSGSSDTVWHRLYLEASIPAQCQVIAHISATDHRTDLPHAAPHLFGGTKRRGVAQAAWLDTPSELPNHPGLLSLERQPDRVGLFSVLIQASSGNVRRIAGRYLRLTLQLLGNSHVSPDIAGLRAYASRFSYRDQYLPRLYREDLGAEGSETAASGPDYLERFLCTMEEPLTMLEGKIAESHVLTRASSAPSEALPWLAQWIGIDMSPGTASASEREALRAAPFTARLHGTVGGLRAALELETGGMFVENPRFAANERPPRLGEMALAEAGQKSIRGLVLSLANFGNGAPAAMLVGGKVSSGAIVVLEGYRMRRTFATILGANLADAEDELTGGLAVSGNSFVGDTLFLGAEYNSDVLALFADTPNPKDLQAVVEFFDALVFRTIVLVHDSATPQLIARLQRIADTESPAHVEVKVIKARYPFLIGAGALVGVDTFLAEPAMRRIFQIGLSQIGASDIVQNPGLLTRSSQGARP